MQLNRVKMETDERIVESDEDSMSSRIRDWIARRADPQGERQKNQTITVDDSQGSFIQSSSA
jgi:hypothetical protein